MQRKKGTKENGTGVRRKGICISLHQGLICRKGKEREREREMETGKENENALLCVCTSNSTGY